MSHPESSSAPKRSRFLTQVLPLVLGLLAIGLISHKIEQRFLHADDRPNLSLENVEIPAMDTAEDYLDVGRRYELGQGVTQDYEIAAQCYLEAAEMGNAEGQFALASLFAQGRGLEQDWEWANHYYRLAAIQGHAGAQYAWAHSLEFGKAIPKNYADAYQYYAAAAKQGHILAHYRVGLFHYAGKGTQASFKKALQHLEIAAKHGVPDAYYVMAKMHEQGHGVPTSEGEAKRLYQKAASKGFSGKWDGEHLFRGDGDADGLGEGSEDELSYAERIERSSMPSAAKRKARQRLQERQQGGAAGATAGKWLDGVLNIPFGSYAKAPVTLEHPREEIGAYMDGVRDTLDKAVYGQEEAKDTLMRVVGQWVANGGAHGEIIGIQGPPGVGKTALVKKGIAEALGRPFVFISLSGARDGSYLKGSDMVFIGSEWGAVAQGLMDAQVMNPVIFFDELDKVGQHAYGAELSNTLIALTDRSQNDRFQDAFFRGVDLDLSKSLIIFSFNDISAVDPILRDRMIVINAEAISSKDKVVIAQNYLLPEILEETGFRGHEINFSNADIRFIIKNYTSEPGVRRLREKLLSIVRDINLKRLQDENFQVPYTVSREEIEKSLGDKAPDQQRIQDKPNVGVVTGLYATADDDGGITLFQVSKKHSQNFLSLELTGNQGDTMRESMATARTVAWNLLSSQQQRKLQQDAPFGLHIHAMSSTAAIPKDGPSGGIAITLAIYSTLTKKPVRHDVAITGEVDLRGNAVAVGGIGAKLRGAKAAGAKVILLPRANKDDVDKVREKDPELFEGITVHLIDTVHDALPYAFG